jgi:hypothetical protein
MDGQPEEILELLSDPDAIARWSPVPFELVAGPQERLEAGSKARVQGDLAGLRIAFDVRILEAREAAFSLAATGPISIEARYMMLEVDDGSRVRATVRVGGRRFLGTVLARATEAVLAAGALQSALERIAAAIERRPDPAYA